MLAIVTATVTGLAVFIAILGGAPLWDTASRQIFSKEIDRMNELGFNMSSFTWLMRIWGALIIFFFLGGLALNSIPLGTCLSFVSVFIPGWVMGFMIQQRTKLLRDQIVIACIGIGNAARANLNLVESIGVAVAETPKPLQTELKTILRKVDLYIPLQEAVADVKNRIRIDGFTVFANAINVADEQGGDVTDALERIATSLQENQRIDRKIEADTQAGKLMVNISTVFPFGFLALFAFLEPDGTLALFKTFMGQVLLAGVILATLAVRRWSESIVNIDV